MSLFYRYLELAHPVWHRAHFNTRWLYISFGINWAYGMIFNGANIIPISKVRKVYKCESRDIPKSAIHEDKGFTVSRPFHSFDWYHSDGTEKSLKL